LNKDILATLETISWQKPERIELLNKTLLGAETYRLFFKDGTAILRSGLNEPEYSYTVQFTKNFMKHNVPVAKILAEIPEKQCLLIEDLGSTSLMDLIQTFQPEVNVARHTEEIIRLYKESLSALLRLQFEAGPELIKDSGDSVIFYDQQKILEDLEYFSVYFLNKRQIDYNLDELAEDSLSLATKLSDRSSNFFYYRDCMARNIMVHNSHPYFIDYVGGREGYIGCLVAGLEESVVTLIQHPRANLSLEQRELLLQFYLSELKKITDYNHEKFLKRYRYYTLVKYLQILGTYGKLASDAEDDKFRKQAPAVIERLHEHCSLFDANEFPELFAIISEVASAIV
jgi:aminoglycoside/choline kinase family phosphotransferase